MSLFKKKKTTSQPETEDPQNQLIAKISSSSNDFEFVQMDKSIHDVRFQSKPTSFFGDAMRRFRKNHSSVVASVILGILIGMAIIVPWADGSNITDSQKQQLLLPPRWHLFAGTGFMDGTIHVDNVVGAIVDTDETTGVTTTTAVSADTDLSKVYPVNYMKSAVVDGTVSRSWATAATASVYGYGGSLGITCGSHTLDGYFLTPRANYKTGNAYTINATFDKAASQGAKVPASYRFVARVIYDKSKLSEVTEIPLCDWTNTYEDFKDENLSTEILNGNPDKSSGSSEFLCQLGLELQTNREFTAANQGNYPSLYLKSYQITLGGGKQDVTWTKYSWTDANEVKLRDTAGTGSVPTEFAWLTDNYAVRSIRDVNIVHCSFRYDKYIDAYGDVFRNDLVYSTEVTGYIKKGWMSLDVSSHDPETIKASFQRLSDKCPLLTVTKVVSEATTVTDTAGKTHVEYVYTICGKVSNYRYYGFSEIPYYVFGTDNHGWDYFKLLFSGLRTSLLLGVACAIINISFGLIWGSISGYFGGWTDLLMERFTEILGGVPWIVVMTLCILNLGQNFGVFLLALCLTGWMGVAGMTRSQFYRFKGREYVLASRTLGANDGRLIFKHILPNSMGTIITGSVLIVPSVIFDEATISYLGLGLKGMNSFGVALSNAQKFLFDAPYMIIWGSIIVSLLMICFNLFGNGLRDAFNPSLKGVDA